MSKHMFILLCATVAACATGARAQTTYYLTPNAPTIPFGSGVAAGLAVAPNSSGGFVTSPVGSANLATGAAAANLGFTPLNSANNLSELSNAATARANLGLGALSTTTPGSGVPAALGAAANGNGGFVTSPVGSANLATGAAAANLGFTPLSRANNLSDLSNAATARTNLGLGAMSITTPGAGVAAALGNAANGSGGFVTSPVAGANLVSGAAAANLGFTPLNPANNLSDLSNPSVARSNLGLGATVFASHSALMSGASTPSTTLGVSSIAQSGYSASGDGGWAAYDWNATSSATADGYAVILPAGQSSGTAGRYILRNNGCINPLAYGAAGNGVTDDTAAVQNAINASVAADVPLCITKLHYISSGLTSSGNPVDIEGFAPVGNDGVSNAQNCLSGLITNSNITMLYLTNSKVTMRNLCEQASTAINARTAGACLSLGGTDQQHDDIEGNTCFRPYDGFDVVADLSSSYVRSAFIAHNVIRDATRYGASQGVAGVGAANAAGITWYDNVIGCDSGQTGSTGFAMFDGAITWDGANVGPNNCYINFAIIPGANQNVNGYLTHEVGDSAGTHGGTNPHDLLIQPTASSAIINFLTIHDAWMSGVMPTDNEVLISNPNGAQISNVNVRGSTIHSAANQQGTPIVDIEGGFLQNWTGNTICAWNPTSGTGDYTTLGVKVNFTSAAQGRYTFNGNTIGGCGDNMTNAMQIVLNGQSGNISVSGGDMTNVTGTPILYTGASNAVVSFGPIAGVSGPATTSVATSNPSSTTSASYVMMGLGTLGAHITPKTSGHVTITVSVELDNSTIGDGGDAVLYYGSGTAPSNGGAVTGTNCTSVSGARAFTSSSSGGNTISVTCDVTGLIVGTQYWADLAFKAVGGGCVQPYSPQVTMVERY